MPVFNGAEHIEGQLLALAAQQTEVSWELILADNGSADGTRGIVRRLSPEINVPVRVVDASARRGPAAARNAGAAAAVGGLLLFTDQDDVVDELWVQEMVLALRVHPFVGGRREFLELNGEEVASWRPNTAASSLPLWGDRPYVIGCNFGCNAAEFAAVGGFDETFMSGGEDIDLSLRMHARGMTAVFAERAVVHYRCRRDPRAVVRQLWRYGRSNGPLYGLHGMDPPTFLDVGLTCSRSFKQAIRTRVSRRRPVRQVANMAYAIGEAAALWRDPAFWRPVYRSERPANPVLVQRARLRRLPSLIVRKAKRP
jgi:glycosyltransferase involved in cell wall biosynthesis